MPRKDGSQVCFSSLLFTVTEQDAAPGSKNCCSTLQRLAEVGETEQRETRDDGEGQGGGKGAAEEGKYGR